MIALSACASNPFAPAFAVVGDEIRLRIGQEAESCAVGFGEYTIELTELTPYPQTDGPIPSASTA